MGMKRCWLSIKRPKVGEWGDTMRGLVGMDLNRYWGRSWMRMKGLLYWDRSWMRMKRLLCQSRSRRWMRMRLLYLNRLRLGIMARVWMLVQM